MHFIRKWIRNLLGFSGRETNGFIILLPVIVIIVSIEPLYRLWVSSRNPDYSHEQKKLDSLVALWQVESDSMKTIAIRPAAVTRRLFRFDPNTASDVELQQLGFPDFLAKRVVTYRQKGGKFYTSDDLRKIYGMDSVLFNSVKNYVSIAQHRNEQSATQLQKPAVQSAKPRLGPFDINEADTATLKSVYGIGTKLADRIVKFRNGLGGFVSLNQLSEIYGLDSAVVNRIKKRAFIDDDFKPKKINLNTTTEFEMSAHPYISKSMAKAIVAWRFQHGAFKTVDEIKNLTLLKSDDIVKIIPYLKVEE
ncbi:MAG TPA: helix-hairpin-helix domain-containing protein [Chryseosolibacter sp.]